MASDVAAARDLAVEWRARADRLEAEARRAWRDGDVLEAQDAEDAANECRSAADELDPLQEAA